MKRVLGKMEHFLEGLVEGLFGRGADNLPAGILRRLATEVEKEAVVKGGRHWAPPDCRILLTREAMRLVLPIQAELEEELRGALARFVAQAGMGFPSPLRFKFGVGDGQGVSVVAVRATFPQPLPDEVQETTIGGRGATAPTMIYRRMGQESPRAWLRVEEGPDAGREFPLIQGKMVVGRGNANHVILSDPNVSRQHATLVFDRGGYSLLDLGSTNGTLVNGKNARKHRLRNGDLIKLGQTVLGFHCQQPHG